jgi:hypothetical protein
MAGVALDTNAEESLFRQLKSLNDVEAQNRGLRRQIRTTAHQGSPIAHRGVRWRLGCYPAVTPALELVRFEFHDPANQRCSSAGLATRKLLADRKIGL